MIGFWLKKRNKELKRAVAGIVVFSFMFSTVAAPFAQASFWGDRQKALQEMGNKKKSYTQLASANTVSMVPSQLGNEVSNFTNSLPKEQSALVQSQLRDALRNPWTLRHQKNQTSQIPAWLWERIAGYGNVEHVYLAKGAQFAFSNGKINSNQPLVIHIQDVHDIYGVQKNLAYLLNELMGMGVDFVGLEGSEGKLDGLETWRQYPDRESLLEVAGYLMKNGLLTGSEMAGLARSRDDIEFYGLEDKENYLTQVNAYKTTLNKSKQAGEWVQNTEAILKDLKEKVDRKSTRLNSSHSAKSRMPSSA